MSAAPVMKLVRTEVKESPRRRIYDEVMKRVERLKSCKTISPKELNRLERKLSELDSIVLREYIEAKLRKIWKLQKVRESKHTA